MMSWSYDMQLAETNQDLNRKITITISSEKINAAIKKELDDISKTIRINGFRKGKVPMQIVSHRYKNSIVLNILSNLMTNNFIDLIMKQKLNLVGLPKYIPGKYTENKDFEYIVEFKSYPLIELKKLKSIKIEKPLVTITESDIDVTVESIRKQYIKWIEKNVKAEKEDRVTIDFISYINGKEVKNGTVFNFILPLGKGYMASSFEDNVIGYKPGDHFDIDSHFPDNYHLKSLRGKKVHFNVTLKKVEKPSLPELNKELIESLGIKDGSISSLRNQVRKNMELDLKTAVYQELKYQIVKEVISVIHVPMSLIDYEIEMMNKKYSQESCLKNKEVSKQYQNMPKNLLIDKATREAAIKLLLNNIITQYDLQADEHSINEIIEEIAVGYKNRKEVINFYKKNDNIIRNIKNLIIERKAIDIVLSNAEVTEKKINFNMIVNNTNIR
ncbi:trigger factor [Candidatus Pantoea edessiphila]|uniref:Trigger factor n=1 Tax=Candidatus Pantoea edessiphila TaxID=2044610 RepID=A0A2P5SXE3_9GAMM|nr:trigger factor [Candidatus Pantoea edessiphila]MBK4775799.1 trigger factor [Pantoea sp. Edef]PPI87017.1 trigger factor [Candidatus Pantoea edessiphila]